MAAVRSTASAAAAPGAAVGSAARAAPVPPALGRETLADRLAQRLAAHIEAGALRPGDRLPTEVQMAAEHGVSRSVVREAVHRIKSRGLVLSRQGSGVFVASPALHRPLEFDAAVLASVQAVVQVAEVRCVLETETAALAAQRATRAQLAGLRRALAAIDAASNAGGDGVAEDLAFHRAIGEATGNPQFGRLLGFLEQYLRESIRVARANEARRSDFIQAVRREHRAIVDAIAAHDAGAARRAVLQHLTHGQRRLQLGGLLPARPARPALPRKTAAAAPTKRGSA